MAADPIHQFEIHKIFTIGHIGGQEIAFTNSSAYMFLSVAVISLLMIGGSAGRQLVPGRIQSMAELSYEFVANTIRSTAGSEGMKFFPLVFSLFMFIMVSNVVGIIPYQFTIASHLIVTAALALLVFFTVLFYGLYQKRPPIFYMFLRVRRADLHPAAGRLHRGDIILPEAGFAFGTTVREHAGRPHRAESVRGLRHHAGGFRHRRLVRRGIAARADHGADRARAPGRVPSGLRLRHPHLHLPQRCYPSGPLIRLISTNLNKEFVSWIRLPRSTLALVLPALAWVAPALALASSSATISPRRCVIPPLPRASSAT